MHLVPKDIWQHSKTFLALASGSMTSLAKVAVKHPMMHSITLRVKNYLAQNVNGTKVESPLLYNLVRFCLEKGFYNYVRKLVDTKAQSNSMQISFRKC
jgi:DNA-binding protein Fis